MAVAIRQTWPTVRFFDKFALTLHERMDEFVAGTVASDDASITLDLVWVGPKPRFLIREALGRSLYRTRPADFLLALANFPRRPTLTDLLTSLRFKENFVRKVLQEECALHLASAGFLTGEGPAGGIERLWLWSRARRAILRREFQ